MNRKVRGAGFTLVELLIVMVVIGVLAALMLPNLAGARQRARDAARKRDFEQIKTALRLYYNDNQSYPTTAVGLPWQGEFSSAGGTIYMKFVPVDPLNSGAYVYTYTQTDGGDGFDLTTELEVVSDGDAARSQLRCQTGTGQVYVVCED